MLPKCPECGGNSFNNINLPKVCSDKKDSQYYVYIVYCDSCGHIIGCYNNK